MRQLSLRPHPEGGWYSEVFRSKAQVTPSGGRGPRSALTSIYFLLAGGQHSRWHRVLSDEAWHFYEGAPLDLFTVNETFERVEHTRLGPHASDPSHDQNATRPTHVVPAGAWQAVRLTGDYALVGCTVGPGFDFADFSMLSDDAAHAAKLVARFPNLADLV
ncbi:MAG: cupin domain-containing protein [Acidobacteria bacterium]|nr:cupin domain-containing protein [Acidobacteriota bacterium]